jgi:hypothetical protein
MPEQPLPTEEQVRGYFDRCSNWGRWGPDDSAGTVNHITPEKRREAAALVKSGRAVSIAYPLNTVGGPGNWNPAQHFVPRSSFSVDYISLLFHGATHVDALCHVYWEGRCTTAIERRNADRRPLRRNRPEERHHHARR